MSLQMDFMFNDLDMSNLLNELDINSELYTRLVNCHRLNRLYFDAAMDGWKYFDWDKAHSLGWFSLSDYRTFLPLKKYKDDAEEDFRRIMEYG